MNRHITITEAKKLCPELIMQHVATWREGDEKWAYHEDAFKHIATHKVSLDPYRRESRRILACIKDSLPAPPLQKVEKASVDEVFLDLSAQIHSILVERYPEISGPAPYDDPTEFLPKPPTSALDWNADALVDLDDSETEDDDPDWDDVVMLIGSEIVRGVRNVIREQLKYTCSAGISHNKMIAKLGSGHRKPNQQTVVRNRAVQQFLGQFKFTKIRNLGGKLGDDIVSKFATDQVSELLRAPLEQLKSKLGDDTGSWVYHIIRGEDTSDVNARTQIKSMLSAKSFRPTINASEQAVRWLRIFVADIMSRLVEDGVLENKRRPKTINLHHRQGGQTRSRQAPIPTGRPIDEALLFDLAQNLLGQAIVDGRLWPCANLSLSVGGFEEGPTGNKGIGGFLVRGEEAKCLSNSMRDDARYVSPIEEADKPAKRRRIDEGGIRTFFGRTQSVQEASAESSDLTEFGYRNGSPSPRPDDHSHAVQANSPSVHRESAPSTRFEKSAALSGTQQATPKIQSSISTYFCAQCKEDVPDSKREEHDDWHFAKSLQAEEQATHANASAQPVAAEAGHNTDSSRKPGRPKAGGTSLQKHVEKGQRKLAFG